MPLIYHGTPLTPVTALRQLRGRAFCIPFARPESLAKVVEISPHLMGDCSAYTFWKQARREGRDWEEAERNWFGYYAWVDAWIWHPGRWAVIPDRIAAPSQLNDALMHEWPHGRTKGAPVWHMDEPIDRLLRLASAFDRVCLGWVGEFDPALGDIRPDERRVGCPAYRARMDQVDAAFGNRWPVVHMFRGIAVAHDYPFDSADASSLAQNAHRYRQPLFAGTRDEWTGLTAYADKLERTRAA